MSCCLTIVLGFIALCVMFLQVIAGLIILDIVFLLLFLGSIGEIDELKKTKPSKMICSNCKSTNVKLSTRKSGDTVSGGHYGHWASGSHKIHYERIAECKSCGFTWNYITQEDIDNELKQTTGAKNLYAFILIVLGAITLWIFLL